VRVRACVCVCDVSISLHLKYLTAWPKRKTRYSIYASGGHQNLVVISTLQSVMAIWRKRELTRLNNTFLSHEVVYGNKYFKNIYHFLNIIFLYKLK
jgi:hypothetical protein